MDKYAPTATHPAEKKPDHVHVIDLTAITKLLIDGRPATCQTCGAVARITWTGEPS